MAVGSPWMPEGHRHICTPGLFPGGLQGLQTMNALPSAPRPCRVCTGVSV